MTTNSQVAGRKAPGESLLLIVAIGEVLWWIAMFALMIGVFSNASVLGYLEHYLGRATSSSVVGVVIKRIVILLTVVAGVAGFAGIQFLFRTFAPSLGIDLAIEENHRRLAHWEKTPVHTRSWGAIFGFTGKLLAGTVAIAGLVLLWQIASRTTGAKVYTINLNQPGPISAKEGDFIEIEGMAKAKAWVSYKAISNDTPQAIAFFTANDWTPDKPIHYFAHFVAELDDTGRKASFPYDISHGYEARFTGKLGGKLPEPVRKAYEAKGLRIDPGYILLDSVDGSTIPRTSEINYNYSLGALVIGGMIIILTLFTLSIAKLMGQWAQRQLTVRNRQ